MTDQEPRPSRDIAVLLEVMKRLRQGCPWDKVQTFDTIAPYTIEEAYEVASAIADKDMRALPGELGDLLFQVVFHARMAEEEGLFDFGDVVEAVTAKMIRRHPHVFGDEKARTDAAAQKDFWEKLKEEERAQSGQTSLLDDVAGALPALTRAEKLQRRASSVGFDWNNAELVLDKLAEEAREVLDATTQEQREEEIGDLLFVVANLARHLKVDPEGALRAANAKFTRRFRHIEAVLAARGIRPGSASLEEMEALWQEAKTKEKLSASDLAALQGSWTQVAFEADGLPDSPDDYGAPGAITTFTDNRFAVRTPDSILLLEGRFELDAASTPKAVNWIDATGPDAGKSLPAIYRLEGNLFAFVAADSGAPRPTEFLTRAGQTMRTFRRSAR